MPSVNNPTTMNRFHSQQFPISRRAMLKTLSSGFGYLAFAGLAARNTCRQLSAMNSRNSRRSP